MFRIKDEPAPYYILSRVDPRFQEKRTARANTFAQPTVALMNRTGVCLDFGCGHREITRALVDLDSDKGRTWLGLDVYDGNKDPQSPRCVIYGGEVIPLVDSSVAGVVAAFVFHHIPRDLHENIFSEIFRVTQPGGRFILHEDHIGFEQDTQPRAFAVKTADALMNTGVPGGHMQGQQSVNAWTKAVQAAGFNYRPDLFRQINSTAALILPWVSNVLVFEKPDVVEA